MGLCAAATFVAFKLYAGGIIQKGQPVTDRAKQRQTDSSLAQVAFARRLAEDTENFGNALLGPIGFSLLVQLESVAKLFCR